MGLVVGRPRGLSFSVQAGWSHRTAKSHPELSALERKHYEGLRSGIHVGSNATYYFSEYIGVGLQYPFSKYSSTTGTIQDNIFMNYIGPAVHGRYVFAKQKFQFTYGLSLGYFHYKSDTYLDQPLTITGSTVGIVTNLGVHFRFTDRFMLGIEPSLITGTLSNVDVSDGRNTVPIELEKDQHENISHFIIPLKLTWEF